MPFISMKCGAKEANLNLCVSYITVYMNQFFSDINEEHDILSMELLWVGYITLQKAAGVTKTFKNVFTFYEDAATINTRIGNCLIDVNTYITFMYDNNADYATPVKYKANVVVTLEYK